MPRIDGQFWYDTNNWGHIEFASKEEMVEGYEECIALLLSQTRWVLDNLDFVKEFEVSWLHYGGKEYCAKTGRKYAVSGPYRGDFA